MAELACVVRQSSDANVGLVINNLQQWNSESYNLNLLKIWYNKDTLHLII
jgi:hypothetical protein